MATHEMKTHWQDQDDHGSPFQLKSNPGKAEWLLCKLDDKAN